MKNRTDEETEFELLNEFGHVRLKKDLSGNGPRLMIEDLSTGYICYMDPLELSSLTTLAVHIQEMIVNPSIRWK
ncbi:hypothetical protein [Paenibacillus zanthoxyli]|uniref:hypothetical protein n=1 Tax=Paenibacillus zanthoxyli TaxID=369399 RepID=UPI0004BB91EB|nr:hypothetical protein [Paenibacillus zanthoxyli]